ncbi:MAG: ribokinase [Clostridia bacterium]|nr:ribokinase [Clostridia bacterium]
MKKILVVGSLNMDLVTKVVATPKIGETISGDGLQFIPGGKGANQAVAMGKLGARVEMIGAIGTDGNGEVLKDNLIKMNVIADRIKNIAEAPTGVAMIMVNASGDNSIVVIAGANGQLLPEDVVDAWFDDVSLVVCQLETPVETVETVLRRAKALGVKTVLNPAPAKALSNELLSCVDLLIPNETEFESLTGVAVETREDLMMGYQAINALGIKEIIVTLGSKGAWYYNGENFLSVAAKKVNAVDTTAAGDSFIAGVCESLARGASMQEALEMGTKVAAITVTRFGAQSSLPTKEEVAGI